MPMNVPNQQLAISFRWRRAKLVLTSNDPDYCATLVQRAAEHVEAMRTAAKNERSESDSERAVSRHNSQPTNLDFLPAQPIIAE